MNALQEKASQLNSALKAAIDATRFTPSADQDDVVSKLLDLDLQKLTEVSGDVLKGLDRECQHQVIDVLLDMLIPGGGVQISNVGKTKWLMGCVYVGNSSKPSWHSESARLIRADRVTQIVPECMRRTGDAETWIYCLSAIADGHRYYISPARLRRPGLDAAIVEVQTAINDAIGGGNDRPTLVRAYGNQYIDIRHARKVDQQCKVDAGRRFTGTYVYGRDNQDVLLAAETDIHIDDRSAVKRDNFVHDEILAAIREGRDARMWRAE
ncbi:hypothetical protein ACEN2Y_00770 (plasmid) [Ralstonia solanacearum]|uniref:hypothetical protein n=1 Tax=Ralstonia solanacearum TaxID=305 RepID=UPI003216EE75